MIELQNVKKVYKSRRHNDCTALKGTSFTLPDVGMVFVLGKSGCGKSTLLNLLGGLDSVTAGQIIVDGNDFSSIETVYGDSFRSSYVGFIFQDFCLLEGLTVAENVRTSLDLLGKVDEGEVMKSLTDVGLEEYADRYPCELSGGQCQRVAIARALVKSPKLILADEPTGNLDSKTAKHVLGILKQLSEHRLVVIVSHNADDAAQYGDRIIELLDGEVVRDIERSREEEAPLIGEDVITLPRESVLSDEELEAINRKLEQGGVRITQAKDPFVKTEQPTESGNHTRFGKPAKMSTKGALKMSSMLAKGGYIGTAVTAVILSVLILILCFAQAFSFFDSTTLIEDAIRKTDEHSFTMHKGYYGESFRETALKLDKTIPVTEDDVKAFYDAGYEGDVYLLYTTWLAFDSTLNDGFVSRGDLSDTTMTYESLYVKNSNGVLATNERFLTEVYGKDGAISLLAGEISDGGVLISDYAADCILNYNEKLRENSDPYSAILEDYISRTSIIGIFETGYKEKYSELFSSYESISQIEDENEKIDAIKDMASTDLFLSFVDEVDKYLGIGYYIGENYQEAVVVDQRINSLPRLHNTDVYTKDGLEFENVTWMYEAYRTLQPGQILIGSGLFNQMFGTNYTYENHEGFVPEMITFVGYENGAKRTSEPIYSYTYTIVGFTKNDDSGPNFPIEDYGKLYEHSHYPYAIYFDNTENADAIYNTGTSMDFYTGNVYFKSIYTVKQIVEIFRSVFVYIGLAIAVVSLLFIVSYSLRSLRRKRNEIGILRALGSTISQIARAFIMQMVALSTVVIVGSAVALPLISGSVNKVLAGNLAIFLDNPALASLEIINVSPLTLLTVLGIFIPVLIISAMVPLAFVRKLKPISILRSTDQ